MDVFGANTKPDIKRDMEKFKIHGRVDFHAGESCEEIEGEDPKIIHIQESLMGGICGEKPCETRNTYGNARASYCCTEYG